MKSKPPTLKDIAQQLGISISTVSRALRGMPEVNNETREAVLRLSKEVDYEPNMLATSLLKRQSNLIGVVVPNMDYFFSTAVKGMDEAALEAGYTVVVCQSNESYGREVANVQRLLQSHVDGFIVSLSSDTQNTDHFKRIVKKEIPLVFFDRDCADIETTKVLLDNHAGAFQAVSHLLEQGFRRIAYLGGRTNLSISNTREQGYLDAITHFGLTVDDAINIHGDFDRNFAYQIVKELLTCQGERPDAFFAVSDRLAIGAFQAIKDLGLSMPQEVGLVGFNDEPIMSLLTPSVSSVSQPAFEMGKTAARLFIEQLQRDSLESNRVEIFSPVLKIRTSSVRI
ncbi:MAG: LacI family DNA-binding transcriptional regulator [Spirosomataceae bacterium]